MSPYLVPALFFLTLSHCTFSVSEVRQLAAYAAALAAATAAGAHHDVQRIAGVPLQLA